MKQLCEFYQITERHDGLVDVWLTPGETVPMYDELTDRRDYGIRILGVRGIDPEDPVFQGDLEGHIREHYAAWLESAEETEI